ncbi:DNA-binding protein [Aerococcus viridans]
MINKSIHYELFFADPKSFDKYIRPHNELERFMIGRHERYTMKSLIHFIERHSV